MERHYYSSSTLNYGSDVVKKVRKSILLFAAAEISASRQLLFLLV